MNIKTKKALFVCAAIVIGSYVVRSFVTSYRQMIYARQQAVTQRAKPSAMATVPKPIDPLVTDAEAMGNLSGAWEGRGNNPARGMCNLHLELKQGDPGHYTGYSRFACISMGSMLDAPKNANTMLSLMQSITPDAAILTGVIEKGAIQLHTNKAIGTDMNGCALTDLTITPFGAAAVAAEWKEGTCQGGNMMMQRAAR
ncbi:MAG: hypothetical protein JO323_17840 [Acidobacteriia bacterium]|nr:hypothetical protein [Terriglobia bacterium]